MPYEPQLANTITVATSRTSSQLAAALLSIGVFISPGMLAPAAEEPLKTR
jgi:hypothetical protein